MRRLVALDCCSLWVGLSASEGWCSPPPLHLDLGEILWRKCLKIEQITAQMLLNIIFKLEKILRRGSGAIPAQTRSVPIRPDSA